MFHLNQLRGTETRGTPTGVHTVDLALQSRLETVIVFSAASEKAVRIRNSDSITGGVRGV